MVIDCGSCQVFPHACSDCVVSVLLGAPGADSSVPEAPIVHLDQAHAGALEVLAGGGLVPPLRLVQGERQAG